MNLLTATTYFSLVLWIIGLCGTPHTKNTNTRRFHDACLWLKLARWIILRMRADAMSASMCARAPVFPEAGGCLTSPLPSRAIEKSVEAHASLLTHAAPASVR